MGIKEQYHRFRVWQQNPTRYTNKNEGKHICANCGQEFEGRYCPICRQEAGDGRISWEWVRASVMNLWGMDSRSILSSLIQLILRPGYFIGEFISGHRMVSYPPVNMLFSVAVIYAIIEQVFGWKVEFVANTKPELGIFYPVINWLINNPGWAMLSVTMIMVFPTWALFHYSPRHSRHTLPEGIFIQIYMATLILICTFMANILSLLYILIPFYYYITYRQLFGYRFWGILWRLFVSFIVWINTITCLGIALLEAESSGSFQSILFSIGILLSISGIVLFFGNRIGKRTEKNALNNLIINYKKTKTHQ